MAIDPILIAGSEALGRRDWPGAILALERAWRWKEGPEQRLCRALVMLSTSLHHAAEGRLEQSGGLLDRARLELASLPEAVLGVDVPRLRAELEGDLDTLLTRPPVPASAPVSRSARLRFAFFVLLLVGTAATFTLTPAHEYLRRDQLLETIGWLGDAWWAPLALIVAYAVVAPLGVPISPLVLAGGALFGVAVGTLVNVVGLFCGAATSYAVAHYLGREFVASLGGAKLRQAERVLQRQSFWSLARVRMLPIPFPVLNFGAALAGLSPTLFLSASTVGLIPSSLVYSYLATTLVDAAQEANSGVLGRVTGALAAAAALTLVPTLLRRLSRSRRLRRLQLERRLRTGSSAAG